MFHSKHSEFLKENICHVFTHYHNTVEFECDVVYELLKELKVLIQMVQDTQILMWCMLILFLTTLQFM